jgi:nucleotide-binding universal stress UspA family protein
MLKERMKVLIAYDGSSYADAALEALRQAGLPREGEALVVTVGDVLMALPASRPEAAVQAPIFRRATSVLAEAQTRVSQALEEAQGLAAQAARRVRQYLPNWEVRAEALVGAPARELIQKAERWKADLVVVGSQGLSALGRLLLGSVSKKVAIEAPGSVRVSRGGAEKGDAASPRIIIGVDGSPEAELAIRAVGERVWPDGTEVRIITADNGVSSRRIASILPSAAAMISDRNEEAAVKARTMVEWGAEELRAIGLNVSVAIEAGDAQRVLVEEARKWGADCIFVGPRNYSGALERLRLGSVSAAVVTNAHCSVEVVRSGERV